MKIIVTKDDEKKINRLEREKKSKNQNSFIRNRKEIKNKNIERDRIIKNILNI